MADAVERARQCIVMLRQYLAAFAQDEVAHAMFRDAERVEAVKQIEQLPPLGQHIRKYRKANRWTLSAFAAEHGMSKAYLWELENGLRTNPSLDAMMKVAKATETTLARVATLAASGLQGKEG